MKKGLLFLLFSACSIFAGAQVTNPIIPGFHPDPSVCRVGNDFYLVNSSFQYFPGVPIYHSRDLQSWQLIGNVLDRQSQLPLKDATSWQGIYAPTIRFHKGVYYMITTNIGNGGNFMVTATNPAGPWSEPIWLQQQGIDPSLLFEDGKCYMVSNPDNTITLCEIDPATGKQLTEGRGIWQGMGGRYPEGPHIYKKDGYYYLLISEGGTELAHSITIARSRNIYGPYEANPKNPILTHCNRQAQDSQIQGTGHGDLIQDVEGQWWLVFLAYRQFNGAYHHIGRETFIAPVEWPRGGWPVVNGGKPIVVNERQPVAIKTTFDKPLGLEWVYQQNPDSACYVLRNNRLHLVGSTSSLLENKQPTFIGRRQEAVKFCFEAKMTDYDLRDTDEAGISVFQINDGNAQLGLIQNNGNATVSLRLNLKNVSTIIGSKQVSGGRLWLRVTSDGDNYQFYCSTDGQQFDHIGDISCTLLSTETAGGFTGASLGLYAYNGGTRSPGHAYADFEYVNYEER